MKISLNRKKNIVVLGGGNGASFMLRALKPFAEHYSLTGIIAMSDSGGSSGFLRKKYGVLPPGDILRALVALSRYDSDVLRDIFYTKRFPALTNFTDEPENAPNLGNLLLTFLQQGNGIIPALNALEEALATVGHVLPITTTHTHLCAELSNGVFTTRECDLDKPNFSRALTVKRVWIEPECEAYENALEALRKADYIFFGPGDVYTSIIATLVPGGVWRALSDSQAQFIQVVARSKHALGEPSPIQLSGIIQEVRSYLPRPVEYVVYNNAPITPKQALVYQQKNWEPIVHDQENVSESRLIGIDFEDEQGGFSWKKLSNFIEDFLIKEDTTIKL